MRSPYLFKVESSSFNKACLVEIGPVVMEKKISSMYLCYFPIIAFWKRTWAFTLRKLNPLYPKMLCTKFGWNWPSGSGEDFIISSKFLFCHFVIISTWKRAGTSFEQIWIPFTQECIVPSLVEIDPMVLDKIFKFRQSIFAISLLSPLGKKALSFIWTNMNPFYPKWLGAQHGWN